ncbi:hypothetical protein, partial [Escherichia coli]|uniref:hypothetical protein n=1 Tax=Escherichia coli TaxID=562 RepID=UPI001BAF724E
FFFFFSHSPFFFFSFSFFLVCEIFLYVTAFCFSVLLESLFIPVKNSGYVAGVTVLVGNSISA